MLICGNEVPASLLAFVIMHGNPKFVSSPVGFCGFMVFHSGVMYSGRSTWQGSSSMSLQDVCYCNNTDDKMY